MVEAGALGCQDHLDLELSLAANFSSRTTRSMACCEVTPTSLRYLRIDILKRSICHSLVYPRQKTVRKGLHPGAAKH
jgi:hypothetical protein